MSDRPLASSPQPADADRRAEVRVPASTLGVVQSRFVGAGALDLVNYTSRSLYGQSSTRLLIGSSISVRLATAALNAVVRGRVVRSSLTQVVNGVPRYEIAVVLDHEMDWGDEPPAAQPEAADVTVTRE